MPESTYSSKNMSSNDAILYFAFARIVVALLNTSPLVCPSALDRSNDDGFQETRALRGNKDEASMWH